MLVEINWQSSTTFAQHFHVHISVKRQILRLYVRESQIQMNVKSIKSDIVKSIQKQNFAFGIKQANI